MNFKQRILSAFIAMAAMFGMFAVTAAPAQAWNFCNPPNQEIQFGYVSFWAGQGRCGEYRTGMIEPDTGSGPICRKMSSYGIDNWGGSAHNRSSSWTVTLFDRDNCGGTNKLVLTPQQPANNLYPAGLFFATSSIQFVR